MDASPRDHARTSAISGTVPPHRFAEGRSRVLEALARGATVSRVLALIVDAIETELTGTVCSILLGAEDGRSLTFGAAPSLPDDVNAGIEGAPVGEGVGACGTAAARGERVIVEDLLQHPYFGAFRHLYVSTGLHACWSEPIRSTSGTTLGTLAIYHREARPPDDHEIEAMETVAALASLAIERARADAALRISEERLALALDASGQYIYDFDLAQGRVFISPRMDTARDGASGETWDFAQWADECIHQDDRDRALAALTAYLEGRTTQLHFEYRRQGSDGQ